MTLLSSRVGFGIRKKKKFPRFSPHEEYFLQAIRFLVAAGNRSGGAERPVLRRGDRQAPRRAGRARPPPRWHANDRQHRRHPPRGPGCEDHGVRSRSSVDNDRPLSKIAAASPAGYQIAREAEWPSFLLPVVYA